MKFFEIMGSGALLLAANLHTKKYFGELGFIDNEHYISVTYENLDAKIKYVLDPANRTIIDQIRANGYSRVQENHLYTHRGDALDDIINDRTNDYRGSFYTKYPN